MHGARKHWNEEALAPPECYDFFVYHFCWPSEANNGLQTTDIINETQV
jgi:hypothetical protein